MVGLGGISCSTAFSTLLFPKCRRNKASGVRKTTMKKISFAEENNYLLLTRDLKCEKDIRNLKRMAKK